LNIPCSFWKAQVEILLRVYIESRAFASPVAFK
jgi:hypothetical protein